MTGTPLNADVGTHNVTLRVTDGVATTDQTFVVTVANTNDAPILVNDAVTVGASTLAQLDVLANDNDPDVGDPLTITAVAQGATGTVAIINAGTAVSYTDTSGTAGSDSFTYTVTDIGGISRTATVSVTVTIDVPPAITSTAVTAVDEDAAYSYPVVASDADGDSAALTAPVLPAWLTFTPAAAGASTSATLTGTPTNAEVGVHNVTLRVTANGVSVDQVFTITVANTNDAPVFTSTAITTATEAVAYSYTATASDVDVGDTLTLSAPTLPAWLSFNATTGVLSGTPLNADVGPHTVVLRVSDGVATADQTFTITVANANDAPTFTSTATTSATEDSPYSYTATVTDPDVGDTLTLSAPTLPAWLSFNTVTGVLSGTPLNGDVGANSVVLQVSDGTVTVDQAFTITVANTNDAPTFTSTPVLSVTDGNQYSYTVVVQDVDPGPDTLTLSAPTLPGWLSFDAATGVLSGTPASVDIGNHPVVIRVNDGAGSGDVDQSFTVVVNAVGTPIAMTQLLDPAGEGGITGIGSFVNGIGISQFEYWTDTYDSAAAVINSDDFAYDYTTQAFVSQAAMTDGLILNGGVWATPASVVVVTPDTGDGSMDISIRDSAGSALQGLRASARFVDISGVALSTHLDAFWQAEALNAGAVFSPGAKLVTQYKLELLSDTYSLGIDRDCESAEPAKFTTLQSNCNSVDSTIDASGFATTLDQLIAATAWTDPDDGSLPPDAVSLAENNGNNTSLTVRLVTGGLANFYVIDNGNGNAALVVPAPVAGTWVRDTTIQGVDMVRLDVPASLKPLFADDLAGGVRFLLAVQNGFVRVGVVSLTGDIELESASPLVNGVALTDILGNFSNPTLPDITSLVGTWVRDTPSFNGDSPVIHFFANGYYESSGTCDADGTTGMEYGTFSWNNVNGAIAASALVSTQGVCSPAVLAAAGSTVTVSADTMTLTIPSIGAVTYTRLRGSPGNPGVGSWIMGNIQDPGEAHMILTVLENGAVMMSQNCTSDAAAGFEFGSYSWDLGVSNAFTGTLSIDSNVSCGIQDSNLGASFSRTAVVTSDTLTLSGAATTFARHSPRAPLTCFYGSGFEESASGGLGLPIVPNSFADYETVLADCALTRTLQTFTRADIAGNTFTDVGAGETTVFNNTGAAATQADPETGSFNDGSGIIAFQWYLEPASCSGCFYTYLVLYTDSTIETSLPAGFQLRETQAVIDITGTSYTNVYYSEQSNAGDMVRDSNADGEIWNSVVIGP